MHRPLNNSYIGNQLIQTSTTYTRQRKTNTYKQMRVGYPDTRIPGYCIFQYEYSYHIYTCEHLTKILKTMTCLISIFLFPFLNTSTLWYGKKTNTRTTLVVTLTHMEKFISLCELCTIVTLPVPISCDQVCYSSDLHDLYILRDALRDGISHFNPVQHSFLWFTSQAIALVKLTLTSRTRA